MGRSPVHCVAGRTPPPRAARADRPVRGPACTIAGVDPSASDYALLDFGRARRLDRFGAVIVDRPAPGVAEIPLLGPGAWAGAAARFGRAAGADDLAGWEATEALPARWEVVIDGLRLELRPTPAGQVGLFPEHAEPAAWAEGRARSIGARLARPLEVLNLFAYTGLATLALARAGARVTHVDASRPAVAWARRNASGAGLDGAPVRWIVEDARAFVAREARRGRRYDGVVLDPPSYGHAPRGGAAWRLETDLGDLLAACAVLTGPTHAFFLLSSHTAGLEAAELRARVAVAFGATLARRAEVVALGVRRPDGRQLPAGHAIRWAS